MTQEFDVIAAALVSPCNQLQAVCLIGYTRGATQLHRSRLTCFPVKPPTAPSSPITRLQARKSISSRSIRTAPASIGSKATALATARLAGGRVEIERAAPGQYLVTVNGKRTERFSLVFAGKKRKQLFATT